MGYVKRDAPSAPRLHAKKKVINIKMFAFFVNQSG